MRTTMKMTGLALVALIGLGATSEAGSITYDFASYSDLQNGWALSGTITTNGTIGTLTAGDISSYSFTITKGSTTLTESSSDPKAAISDVLGLQASSTALTMPTPAASSFSAFEIGNSTSGQELTYNRGNGATKGNVSDDYLESNTASGSLQDSWSAVTSTSNTLSLGSENPWTIATASAVPEPSSLVLAGIALVGGTVVAIRRRRK
jgi:hypothetical protein